MSKKESYWFSHDSNAASNPKLVALISKYGFEGYGRWWRLLERLRDCDEYKYNTGTAFAYDVLAKDLLMTTEEAIAFVQDCVEYFQLLQCDDEYIWSDSLIARMDYWEKRREVLRERGRKGAAVTNAKKKKQKEERLSDDASDAKPQHKTANETKQNQTKQNETTSDIVDDEEDFKGGIEMSREQNSFDVLRKQALADGQRFVYPFVSSGRVNKEQLAKWLTAFNKWLDFTGEAVKTERDYRRHFAAWFRYRDLSKETPETYNPATPNVQEAPASSTVPLPVIIPKDMPKTKFKKGENSYDMHWLKGLKDEITKMG